MQRVAPEAPLLALGQTVLWDEPMKAGVALTLRAAGQDRRFVCGVHDTDYFAKLPGGGPPRYRAVGHNDTTTKNLWSAAAEFSTLFGSETIVTRDALAQAGVKLARIERERPGLLDEATEAWGWRGLVSSGGDARVTAETPLAPLFDVLVETLDWAVEGAVGLVAGRGREAAEAQAARLRDLMCDASEPRESLSLAEYYRRLLPRLHEFVTGEPVPADATTTSELLRLGRDTADSPRFDLLGLFLDPGTRERACEAYDDTVRGTEVYTLDRFGVGAIPFDLVVPGRGRGTLRVGNRALIVTTPRPLFVTLRRPVRTVRDLAEAIEDKFGPGCVLVGKALTLIGMLAREFVFVFHEGASGYVSQSRAFHQRLASSGLPLDLRPILRVRYEPWDALDRSDAWLRLPDPMTRAFGADEMCASGFAARWREVVEQQNALRRELALLRAPLELFRFLANRIGGGWVTTSAEYEAIRDRLDELEGQIAEVRASKAEALSALRVARRRRVEAERASGIHWRERIFEKNPSSADLAERERHRAEVVAAIDAVAAARRAWRELDARQAELVAAPEIVEAHRRRRDLELEAELKRLKLARNSVIVGQGLVKAGHRPSAWWFPLVSPDGSWFRETMRCARYYLEPLC